MERSRAEVARLGGVPPDPLGQVGLPIPLHRLRTIRQGLAVFFLHLPKLTDPPQAL